MKSTKTYSPTESFIPPKLHSSFQARRENGNSKSGELDTTGFNMHSATARPNAFAHDFSRIPPYASDYATRIPADQIRRQHGTDDPLTGNQPLVGGIFFCDLYDPAQIRTAVSTAQGWISTVVPIVELFKMNRLSGDRETGVRIALKDNFNIDDPFPRFSLLPRPLDTLINNLKAIETALNQPLQFYCTNACLPGDLAWMLQHPEKLGLPPNIINICPAFFGCDPLSQASTMIHERAHEAIGAQDRAYEVRSDYDSLSTVTALENADSYAVFVRQVYHNGIHGPGMGCSILTSRIRDFKLSEPKLEIPKKRPPSLLTPPSP